MICLVVGPLAGCRHVPPGFPALSPTLIKCSCSRSADAAAPALSPCRNPVTLHHPKPTLTPGVLRSSCRHDAAPAPARQPTRQRRDVATSPSSYGALHQCCSTLVRHSLQQQAVADVRGGQAVGGGGRQCGEGQRGGAGLRHVGAR